MDGLTTPCAYSAGHLLVLPYGAGMPLVGTTQDRVVGPGAAWERNDTQRNTRDGMHSNTHFLSRFVDKLDNRASANNRT